MNSTDEKDNSTLAGRGEKSTLRFLCYIFAQVLSENKALYGLIWTALVAYGVIEYFRLITDCETVLNAWKPLIDILAGIGAFTAPFIFVIIGVFPSFSEKFRIRLEKPSRRTGKPLAQSMLDHFAFVLVSALAMMLIGYLAKYLVEIKSLGCSNMSEIRAGLLSSMVVIILMMLAATMIELLRSVRTMYIMIVADYSK